MRTKSGETHEARKAIFRKGVREGKLTIADIEDAIPEGGLTPAERWLLYYSLRAAEVEIVGSERERAILEGEEGPSEL